MFKKVIFTFKELLMEDILLLRISHPEMELEIVGTNGTLRWEDADGTLIHYRMPDVFGEISSQPSPAVETRFPVPDGFERNRLFVAQMRHFLEVARGEAEPVCTLDDGIRVMELVLAATESRK